MRQDGNTTDGIRSSALWGKRSSGSRPSALWGKGGRGIATALSLAVALTMPAAGLAGKAAAKPGKGKQATAEQLEAGAKPFVAPDLLAQAKKAPKRQFDVIVQGILGESSRKVENRVKGVGGGVKKRFRSVTGVAARVPGSAILGLAKNPHVLSVTRDARVKLASYSSGQQWPYVMELSKFWDGIKSGLKSPTIAIVDSGIEKSRSDFGGRVVADVTMTSLAPNSPGDGRGHGTFVAGIAAGQQSNYTGGAPNAKIVSIDVMDDSGMAMTSDVIAAADWILRNKDTYGIRIANFSLHAGVASSFMFDPLDKAVEKLWFNGVVVVASAGNYGVNGQPSGVPTPPGNDPFIITVGAADIGGTMGLSDDLAAPWSAYGYTLDGFAKPDVGAPGRYIVGPVPATSTLVEERPANVVSGGYMRLSGTSFSAPAVTAAAAYVLAVNPTWTPDQVKGALMVSAAAPPNAAPLSVGVGEVKAAKAASVANPPNPNLALNRFLTMDASGAPGPAFDAARWASTAMSDASWASASWASASWASASWSAASWASASWASASWASASWASAAFADASWASASWASASWASASWADNAIGE
jgi:serine protease AprX